MMYRFSSYYVIVWITDEQDDCVQNNKWYLLWLHAGVDSVSVYMCVYVCVCVCVCMYIYIYIYTKERGVNGKIDEQIHIQVDRKLYR